MIRPRLAPVARRELRNLPLAEAIDLLGLVVVGALVAALVAGGLPFPEAKPFMLTLGGSSLLVWLVVARLRPSRGAWAPQHAYRYLLAPFAASVLALLISAGLRDYYSGRALLAFAVGWTAWIALNRYLVHSYRPKRRILWLGSPPKGWHPDGFPGLRVQIAARPPKEWEGWDVVVVGDGVARSDAWASWLIHAELADAEILSEPKAYEVLAGRIPLDAIREDLLAIVFRDKRPYIRTQRTMDLLAILLFSPAILLLCTLVALIVWADTGRPVIYSQLRTGRDGEPFRLYKFRTMRHDAELQGPSFTHHGDVRVTPIGAFLRKFRLDELPQFWNVVTGEMSIIGPRPEQVPFVEEFSRTIPLYDYRHLVKPGITGWAQVSQGYASNTDQTRDKLGFDLYYVKHQSWLLDTLIVIKTLRTIASGFGAR